MNAKTELAAREEQQLTTAQTMTPLDMLNRALEKGVTGDELSKFMDLHDRWQAAQAKRAFDVALAEFKKNPPKVIHDKMNKQYGSTYSSLANLVNTVNAALSNYGLSATWEYEQGEQISVTCILAHVDGHSIRTKLSGPPDDSGSKNDLQKIKSTTTYLRAATFEAVTGIATFAANKDDDGNGTGKKDEPISESELADLNALCDEVNADKEAFCKVLKVESLAVLPQSKLKGAIARLEKKRGQK